MNPKAHLSSFLARIATAAVVLLCHNCFAQYTETTLHTFTASIDGSYGNSAVPDGRGNLWGTNPGGGANGQGAFYELVPAASGHGWEERLLYSFPVSTSLAGVSSPSHPLVHDAGGNFYGLSPQDGNFCEIGGGPGACGTVWKLSYTANGWVRTIIYSFTGGTDQAGPASLTIDSKGNLYGVTNGYSYGTIFELSPSGGNWTFKNLYVFSGGSDGSSPNTVILDKFGNLYGTTIYGGSNDGGSCSSNDGSGCGVVFELSPGTNGNWTCTTLYSFLNQNDGAQPYGPLILSGGNLFGTAGGGANLLGVVFEISRGAGGIMESVPYTFTGYGYPSGITADAAGNLYGATSRGGLLTACGQGCGTLFELSRSSSAWIYTTLYSFTDEYDGSYPSAPVLDNEGNLFTMTEGQGYAGSVPEIEFELSPVSGGKWQGSVVHDFPSSTDGFNPQSSLVRDAQGNLYGTTTGGGAYGWGAVFELIPSGSTWLEKTIYSFHDAADGAVPNTGLALDASGNLYGVTPYGGGSLNCQLGCGTVFKLSPNSSGGWSYSLIHTFVNGVDGSYPRSGVTVDAAGNVYGTSSVVFKLSPTTHGEWPFSVLFRFNGSDGNTPQFESALTLDGSGNLYGVTAFGGVHSHGVVYKLSPTSSGPWNQTVLYNITAAQSGSVGALALDHSGNIYGTIWGGGTNANFGSVFELTPANGSWTFNTIYSFTGGSDGAWPKGGVIFDTAGNLYGVSDTAVYKLAPTSGGWQETTIFSSLPEDAHTLNLVIDPSGDLYGTNLNENELQSPLSNTVWELTP